MYNFINNGGIVQWVLLLIVIFIVKQSLSIFYSAKKKDINKIIRTANSVLFWGCVSLLISLAFFFISFYNFGKNIIEARQVSASITIAGIANGFAPIISGIFILLFSLSLWYIILKVYKK